MTGTLKFLAALALCFILRGAAQEPGKAPFDIISEEAKASQGDIHAMTKLGLAYFGKQGIPANLERARMWLNRAAEAGSLEAQVFLGAAYMSGSGLQKDLGMAAKYLLQAAQQQNVEGGLRSSQALAQYWVAMLYEQGRGIDKSHEKAIQFLQLAAKNGSYVAQFDLGALYNDGTGGLEMDKVRACHLFEKAADQGHTRAAHNAGYCHQVGVGGKKDPEKAIHYYAMAAESGDARSQHNLAMVFGALGNAERAYFWLRVAESFGFQEDQSLIEAAKARLSASQVEREDKEILAWLNAHKAEEPGTLKQ